MRPTARHPGRGEHIYIVELSPTGQHADPYGRRFKEIHRQRCWFIKEIRRNHGGRDH